MHGARNGIVNIIITREIHTLLNRDKSSIVQSARNIGKSSSFCGFAVGLAEMAHFSLVDHKANGTFAYRDQQRGQQEYEGCEPDKPTSAKQRHFKTQYCGRNTTKAEQKEKKKGNFLKSP